MNETTNSWRIDKHIPIALIVALLMQTSAIVWWAARIETRVELLEQRSIQNQVIIERVSRVEEKVSALRDTSLRIESKLDTYQSRKRQRQE